MERIRAAVLYRYEMPLAPFRLIDEGAGYGWPTKASRARDDADRGSAGGDRGDRRNAGGADVAREVHDAVKASGLTFSMIRMRNAVGR